MIIKDTQAKIWIRSGKTDLRQGIRGLSVLIESEMKLDVLSGNIFIFCNKSRKLIKALYWDKTGFWLCQKRLEKATWPWPKTNEEAKEISYEQLVMLLQGIDFFKAHEEVTYKGIC